MQSKHQIVFILGGPGSGKGTQSSLINTNFSFTHLSAGDLLRQQRKSGSSNGDLIESYIKQGKIVPSEITVKLLSNAMDKSQNNKFLIDGFPRNQQNLENWEKIMVTTTETLFETMVNRLLNRGLNSGRVDDNIESIKKRLHTATVETGPIIEEFRKRGKLVEVESESPVEQVFGELKTHFEKI